MGPSEGTEPVGAAEAARATNEAQFRLLVEQVSEYAIFLLDPAGYVTTWNSGAQRIKGFGADEIVGQHFSRFYLDDDVRAGKCEAALALATREGRVESEGWRVRKDGTQFWANVVITALRGPQGDLVGFAKITRDMTERRAADAERLRLGQEARERVRALATLSEALAKATTVQAIGNAAVDSGTNFVGSDTCTLYLLDERTKALELVAERGCSPAIIERIRRIEAESGNPTYGVGAAGAEDIWVETPEQYEALMPSLARARVEGPRARAFACVALEAEQQTIGMLGLGFFEPRRFSEDDREFTRMFARLCAEAIARVQLVEAERTAGALADRLRASLSTTLRSIGDAVIATDSRGAITLMNGVAEALTGFTEAEAAGKSLPEVFRIVNEHTRAVVPNPVEKVLATGGIVGLANHTVLIARDGRETPIDDSGAPIRSEAGAIDGVVLVFRDVSERKRAESRQTFLAEAASTLGESLDYEQTVGRVAMLAVPRLADWCAVDLVIEGQTRPKRLAVAHVDPKKVELAKELDAKYPPPADALTGVPNVLRTGRAELYPEIPDEMLVAVCVDAEHLRIARELRLRSAMIVPLAARGRVLGAMSFVFAESGRTYTESDLAVAEELAGRCAMAIDNARLYRSEQRARHLADLANRAKDDFLGVVSHELRTPLNAIMGWARMLTKPELDERRKLVAVETINRSSVAMAQLIEDLLDTSRVISGKLRLQLQKVEISRVISAALDSVRPEAAKKDIEIVADVDAQAPTIAGDPTRIQQIVWNLLSNAIKFSKKGGQVFVSLRTLEAFVEIAIADTGQGIAPEFLPHVFEPFQQQDASASRVHGGLGLGLAISRELVERHGGRITAQSEGEGRGATFTVALPVSSAEQAELRDGPRSDARASLEAPAHLKGLHVLVVDDDNDARQLVATILEECGCRVTVAASAGDGLQKLTEARPDLLLSDIGMPGEDGYELIRKVRALPREQGGGIPAAAITAYTRPEDRRRIINAGFSVHLPKPVDPAELVAMVSSISRFIGS